MNGPPSTGWRGKLLHVDLGQGTARIEDIPRDFLLRYLGGRGLGVRFLRDVHTLASTYGWREADILALSPWRRQYYLALIAGSTV